MATQIAKPTLATVLFVYAVIAVGLTEAQDVNATANALDNLLFGPACSRESFRAVRKICESISPICSTNSSSSGSTGSGSGGSSACSKTDNTFCTDLFTTVVDNGSVTYSGFTNITVPAECLFVIANPSNKNVGVTCEKADTKADRGSITVIVDKSAYDAYQGANYAFGTTPSILTSSALYLRLSTGPPFTAEKIVKCTWKVY